MNKTVFFLETGATLTDTQKIVMKLATSVAKLGNDVIFVNDVLPDDEDFTDEVANIFQLTADTDFASLNGATFFAPCNYLLHLLAHIKGLNDAKVCLYSYNARAVDWLVSHFNNAHCAQSIKSLLTDTNALSYMSGACVMPQYKDEEKELIYIPPFVCGEPRFVAQPIVDENVINIGVYGDFSASHGNMLANLVRNLRVQNLDRRVNIHIVGKTKTMFSGQFSDCSSNYVSLIYTGKMTFEDCNEYIRNNVDVVLANGSSAIDAVKFGVPVVIPVVDAKPFEGNRYVYIFDVNDEVYEWNSAELLRLDNDSVTFRTVLKDIYERGRKEEIAKKCFDFVAEYNSEKYATDSFFKQVSLCELTLEKCLDNKYICDRLKDHSESDEKENGFGEFLKKEKGAAQTVQEQSKEPFAKIVINKAKALKKRCRFIRVQNSYASKIARIRAIYKKNGKIKVAFIVVFKSVFPMRPIFEKMCADPCFDPYIIVAPNVSRTMKYQRDLYDDTYEGLKAEYGDRVIGGYDKQTDEYLELKDEYSIIFFCNPYKHLVHRYHEIEYFLDKPVLSLYSSYGFAALKFWDEVIATDFYNYVWKACVETPSNLKHLQQVQKIKGRNGVVTGYVKADGLADFKPEPRDRKRILICPHHTVWGWKNLNISNFLTYSELFVELPKMFPDIDFVFRPHPLLMDNLKAHKVWTQQQIDEYLERLLESPNMEYDTSGDYYQKFVDSDAMIHDCGSFIGEYLYTEKPCCYMIKSEEETYKGLVPLGQQCMDQYYHALSREDIIDFIQNVVVDGNDTKKAQREKFVRTELKANYPHASDTTISLIKKELKIK